MCLFIWSNTDNEGLVTKLFISTTSDVYLATKALSQTQGFVALKVDTFCTETSPVPTHVCTCSVAIWFHGEDAMVEFKIMNILNLNLSNTCKTADAVLVLFSDESGLILCITAALPLVMKVFILKHSSKSILKINFKKLCVKFHQFAEPAVLMWSGQGPAFGILCRF